MYLFTYIFFNISLFPKTSERKLYDQPTTVNVKFLSAKELLRDFEQEIDHERKNPLYWTSKRFQTYDRSWKKERSLQKIWVCTTSVFHLLSLPKKTENTS